MLHVLPVGSGEYILDDLFRSFPCMRLRVEASKVRAFFAGTYGSYELLGIQQDVPHDLRKLVSRYAF